jgi:hypothetical protein
MYGETLGKKIGFFQDPALDFIEFAPACSAHSKSLAVEEHNRALVSSLAVDFSHVVTVSYITIKISLTSYIRHR